MQLHSLRMPKTSSTTQAGWKTCTKKSYLSMLRRLSASSFSFRFFSSSSFWILCITDSLGDTGTIGSSTTSPPCSSSTALSACSAFSLSLNRSPIERKEPAFSRRLGLLSVTAAAFSWFSASNCLASAAASSTRLARAASLYLCCASSLVNHCCSSLVGLCSSFVSHCCSHVCHCCSD
ncbi:unnamed protein product [Chrysoparadoxa australica]